MTFRPTQPTFNKKFDLVMRPLGGDYVSRDEVKAPIQYCRLIDRDGKTVYRCSPLAHEAMNEPQTNFTEYPELPEGALEV